MNLNLLIERWEKEMQSCNLVEQAVYRKCISDVQMLASGERREPYTLDSRSPFKRHNGASIREAMDMEQQNPKGSSFFDWALQTHSAWFTLDEDAHNYLCELQEAEKDKYNDEPYKHFGA